MENKLYINKNLRISILFIGLAFFLSGCFHVPANNNQGNNQNQAGEVNDDENVNDDVNDDEDNDNGNVNDDDEDNDNDNSNTNDDDEDNDNDNSNTNDDDDVSLSQAFNISAQNFLFNTTEIKVKQGTKVTINFTSLGGFHDWKIDEFNAATAQINTGGSSSVTFTADKTGTFEFYCSVGQHRAMGMVGKLIVE